MPTPACGHCGYGADGLRGPTCPECGLPWAEELPRPSLDLRIGSAWIFFIVAVLLSAVVWYTFNANQWWAPRSLPLILSGMLLGGPVGCAMAGGVFAGLHAIPIAGGRTRMDAHLIAPVGVLLLLQWLWLGAGIDYGLRYQGAAYVTSCVASQAMVTALLVGIAFWATRKRSFLRCALFAAASGLWLSTYAFPWLGETP